MNYYVSENSRRGKVLSMSQELKLGQHSQWIWGHKVEVKMRLWWQLHAEWDRKQKNRYLGINKVHE